VSVSKPLQSYGDVPYILFLCAGGQKESITELHMAHQGNPGFIESVSKSNCLRCSTPSSERRALGSCFSSTEGMHTQIQVEATKFSYDRCYMRTEHVHKYDYVDIWLHQHEYDYSSLGRTGSTSTLSCAASTRLSAVAALHRLRRMPPRRCLLGVRLPRRLTSTSLNQKTSRGRLPRHQQLVGSTSN
jgi:hypothetical protein